MTSSDAISIIQTILAIGGFIFAYAEFKKWRTELLGSKKIEVALRLGKAAIEAREAFAGARNPFGQNAPEYKPNSTPDQKYQQDQEYDFNQRLQLVAAKLEPLYDIRWKSLFYSVTMKTLQNR